MAAYYPCKHFKIEELVSKKVFKKLGNKAWRMFRPELLITIDYLRDKLGSPITINSWKTGGTAQYRGFREKNCAVGSELSMHRCGMAVDLFVLNMPSEEVRQYIFKYQEQFPHITRIERATPHVHLECGNASRSSGIALFNP